MLKRSFITAIIVALMATWGTLGAQEKYAVIIGGNVNPDENIIPPTEQWNGGPDEFNNDFDEIWNDLYLAWEMLVFHKDYSDENVHVMFGGNPVQDYTFPEQNIRYKAENHQGYTVVTDEDANKSTIQIRFTSLASTITEDDFLFVWIMGHGGSNPFLGNYFYSYDNQRVTDNDLATWLGNIPAYKKVVYLSFPKSGAFASQLEDNGIIVIASSGATEGASRADDLAPNGPFIENEVRNNITYNHGEINYHFTSSLTGFTPWPDDQYAGIDLADADVDSDNFIDIDECFDWITTYETVGETPVCSDQDGIKAMTELTYPTLLHFDLNYPTTVCRGLIGVSKDVQLVMSSLTFLDDSKIYFLNESTELSAGNITALTFGDRCELTGTGTSNLINVTTGCSIAFGDYMNISTDDPSKYWEIDIQTETWPIKMDHIEISNTELYILSGTFELTNSTLNSAYITHQYGINNLQIDETILSDASLSIYYGKPEITNCQFSNTLQGTLWSIPDYLRIISCPEFLVSGNTLNKAGGNGISIFYSGDTLGSHLLTENNITYSGQYTTNKSGIFCYNSYVDIVNNEEIAYNDFGVTSVNNSNVKLLGNRSAYYTYETQQIYDNAVNQVYATDGAFPYEFRFNAVYDNDNTCLVKFIDDPQGIAPNLDVRYNYWGTSFDPLTDLCPYNLYTYLPVWNLQEQTPAIENDESLFIQAGELADSSQYAQAKASYAQLISEYPESEYAGASLKELLKIEKSSTKDYSTLKSYYTSFISQCADSSLCKTADFLSNLCDVEMKNYSTAIAWYENVIQDPPTFEDSLFAIIDLGNLYLKIEEDSLKAAPVGALSEHKPLSQKQYTENRDYLISLLFKDENATMQPGPELSEEKPAALTPNAPNPFVGSTMVNYELTQETNIEICVYDYTGKIVKTLKEGNKETGKHTTKLHSGDLAPGIYFCAIKCNGILSDTQKITIIK